MTLDITITDQYCGAGGNSEAIRQTGKARTALAINHWKRAIETHNRNFPEVQHILTDLLIANPRRFPRTTGLVSSPECTSHTLAKGRSRMGQAQPDLWDDGDPDPGWEAEERSRCTMWTPLDWAECHDYQFVVLENVVDVHLWRPFHSWLSAWTSLDYDFELVYLNSMHAHPTPQSRDRMYFVAWKRGNRRPNLKITPLAYCQKCEQNVESVQSWKNPNKRWGKYKQQYVYRCPSCATEVIPYYYAAANAIDWSLPAPRIGDRKKPLQPRTMKRIEHGLEKFAEPFSVQVNKTTDRLHSLIGESFQTQTADNGLALVLPFLLNLNHADVRPLAVGEQPFPTQTAYDDTALVLPFIAELHGTSTARSVTEPLATVCAGGRHHALPLPPTQEAWLMTYYQHGQLSPVEEAVPTVTTLQRHALVTGEWHQGKIQAEECGFRMLVPKEIQAAMAFPGDYVITGTRREQVKQLGNAVTPPVMRVLIERVVESLK
jgi:DNA (cytosine-5)-methyltransferase 1